MTAIDLVANDAIVARNFYLELDGQPALLLTGVSGLEIELDVVPLQVNGKKGKQQHIKTLGGLLKAPDIQITRMAPLKATEDPIWEWFLKIRASGMHAAERATHRKHGSIVLYDSGWQEVGRFEFFNGWPSKIATDALSTDSNEPMKENITLVVERIERTK